MGLCELIRCRFRLKSESGQTSVEYILLLAVAIAIIMTIMGNVRDRLIARETPCPETDRSLGCTITRGVSSFGATSPSFRFFRLRR